MFHHESSVLAVAFGPDVSTNACGTQQTVVLYRLSDCRQIYEFEHKDIGLEEDAEQVDFAPNGKFAACATNHKLVLYDTVLKQTIHLINLDGETRSGIMMLGLRFSANSDYVGAASMHVWVWNV